jgi:hypothetical protein
MDFLLSKTPAGAPAGALPTYFRSPREAIMSCSVRSCVLGSAACVALAVGPASAADPALNILFYGSSYTTPGDSGASVHPYTVPYLVKGIAKASGRTAPNVENASTYGGSLEGHIQNDTGFISNPIDFTESPGFKWNYVVLQESTLIPTNVTASIDESRTGDPEAFKANANTLYGLVKNHSPNAKAVLYETWAESPHSTTRLATFYPAPVGYVAKANQMSAELHQYYGEARTLLGSSASIAHVNDAFKASGYEDTLYRLGFDGTGDWRHPSPKGTLLAAMILYDTIYQTDASLISYSQMNLALTQMNSSWPLSAYGIDNTTEWNALTGLAQSVVPEPAGLGALVVGGMLFMCRRNRA